MHALPWSQPWLQLSDTFYRRSEPDPLTEPYILHANAAAGKMLGVSADRLNDESALNFFALGRIPASTSPVATAYAGHQFGIFTSALGDGRAVSLGRLPAEDGESYDIQLKGAGKTLYSRTLDGRYPQGSAIREYLCGEALTALGIASTRGLCLVGSRTEIRNEKAETAAVLVRMAKSHVRFGHFEYFHHADRFDELRDLFDFTIELHFPECLNETAEKRPMLFLKTIVERTACLIADWQCAGFVHGVMNTDNMAVSGETLDLGPYGFIESYDPAFSPNPADDQNRYQFDQQPEIGRWNCLALAQALTSLLPSQAVPAGLLRLYRQCYNRRFLERMRAKLGLFCGHPGDGDLIDGLLSMLKLTGADYHLVFRSLADIGLRGRYPDSAKAGPFTDAWRNWLETYRQRLALEKIPHAERRRRMNQINPCYLPRAQLLVTAVGEARRGDLGELYRLFDLLQKPFEEKPGTDFYCLPPADKPQRAAGGA